MRMRLGKRYGGLAHGLGCACHTPSIMEINNRLSAGLSRRSILKGLAGSLAASSIGSLPAFAQDAAKPVHFTNVRIFDGRQGTLVEGSGVLVVGNKIDALVPAAEKVADADVIDCGGRALMPGLVDAHWHALL